ncbi:hypothetical protein [Clostridium butyricum]|uniref:hypothetical protein n=1 Tax=Clostridium butyricum TaxID=1492 RepID=UPI002AB29DC3|nr:hypothetical protein [Clostridium butyricum]
MKKNLLKTLVIMPLSFNLCSVSAYAENKIEDTTYNTISFSSELETRTKNIIGEEMSSSNITTDSAVKLNTNATTDSSVKLEIEDIEFNEEIEELQANIKGIPNIGEILSLDIKAYNCLKKEVPLNKQYLKYRWIGNDTVLGTQNELKIENYMTNYDIYCEVTYDN